MLHCAMSCVDVLSSSVMDYIAPLPPHLSLLFPEYSAVKQPRERSRKERGEMKQIVF